MSVNLNFFNAFKADLANKVHNLASDTITCVLCASANAPVATNAVLSDLTTIDMTNLSSRNFTTTSSTQMGGIERLILADLVLTASGAVPTFRYVALYNSTAAGHNLIGWFDYGADITLSASGQTFTIDLDNVNGLFSLT